VDVWRDEAAGCEEEFARDPLVGPLAEDDALPRDGVDDCI
jgi:hypothetical protein